MLIIGSYCIDIQTGRPARREHVHVCSIKCVLIRIEIFASAKKFILNCFFFLL